VNDATKKRLIKITERLLPSYDWRAIRKLWQPYVDQGDLDAKACLAHLILYYSSAPQRVDDEMREYLRLAAEAGHADAIYWTTRRGKEDEPETSESLLRAGELGSRGAQRDLGALYATGDWSGPKDPALGVHWYRKAAERGHEDAQYNLGFMYLLGEGTEQDVAEGLLWLTRSAMQGDWSARRLLADLYRNGYYGVAKSIEQAERWAFLQKVTEIKMRRRRGSKRVRLDELCLSD
jgi:TPR repeat protein